MYPDWPQSTADLVPLPQCDGPKLKPFDVQGPQKIKFLDHLGEGLHAHVFTVAILEHVYALKLFRFVYDYDWLGPAECTRPEDLEAMSAFYRYSEPFSAECRAFCRLQEASNHELAVRCFGYLLLNEEHERVMMDQFSHLDLDFNWNGDRPGAEDMRSRFLGRDGRPPPLRGIVKAFGQDDEPLRTRDAKRLLRDVVRLQQLGIIYIDVAHRQLINGRISDFSTAITIPHFITTPELNPRLTPEWIHAIEFETFQFSINDYWDFDSMVELWNDEHENRKDQISFYAFPGGHGCQIHYNLRRRPSLERVYTLVDPRLYDWRTSVNADVRTRAIGAASGRRSGQKAKGSSPGKTKGAISKTCRRLDARPPRWYYECDSNVAITLKSRTTFSTSLSWEYKDGLIFPQKKN